MAGDKPWRDPACPLTGQQLWHRQTVKTERAAQVALGKLLEQAEAGRRPDTGITVSEAITQYMEVTQLDLSTRRTYEGYITRTILPALGSMELRKVRGPLLDTFYARLRRCGDLACTGRPFVDIAVTVLAERLQYIVKQLGGVGCELPASAYIFSHELVAPRSPWHRRLNAN